MENSFSALSLDHVDQINQQEFAVNPINTDSFNINTINFNEEKEFQTVKNRKSYPKKIIAENIADNQKFNTSLKLSNFINNTEEYLKLAKEGINYMCSKAMNNIQSRQNKIPSGTWSMNILGPVFCDDFYVQFNSEKCALVKEDDIKDGYLEIDDIQYPVHAQNSIRVWDLMCGPTDRPTLFKENNMLSLGEKLQDILQRDMHNDLITSGKLKPEEPYNPTVWLFLAYRFNFKEIKKPCRFINMCWNSDGTAPKSLIKVSDYHIRIHKQKKTYADNRPIYQNMNKMTLFKPFVPNKK
jgi:hypothetical protein